MNKFSFLGCLEDMNLSEVLQIISLGKRSGTLTLIGKRGSGRVLINKGRVVYASCEFQNRLGYTLVEKGIVSLRDVKRVLREQSRSKSPPPIGTLLLQKGLVSREVLEAEIRDQIFKVFKDLLGWKEGFFYFEKQRKSQGPIMVHEGLKAEMVLIESTRLRDEEDQQVDRELWT